jgi:cellulose synthase/poly-beta-1,6-N-acetylglucosamine synthase-like glycosyltransferase
MTPDDITSVSIVVACRNERDYIEELLESILAQEAGGIQWEVLVADGLSDDGTREILDAYSNKDPRITVITNGGLIVSTGLNAAIRQARGEFIIRMDAHTSYAPGYCAACITALKTTGADNVGGPARTMAFTNKGKAVAAAFHSPFSTGGAKFHDVDYEGWVDTVPYGCWRKSTLERIGLFDEQLVRNQDDELNLRLQRAGGRIWQTPAAVCWYSPRTDLGKLFRQYFQYGFWKVAVIRKHRLPSSLRQLVPGMFVLNLLGLPVAVALSLALHCTQMLDITAVLWLMSIALYFLATGCASLLTARKHGWFLLPYLPLVFATFHLSYGAGFLAGLLKPTVHTTGSLRADKSVFTKLSR